MRAFERGAKAAADARRVEEARTAVNRIRKIAQGMDWRPRTAVTVAVSQKNLDAPVWLTWFDRHGLCVRRDFLTFMQAQQGDQEIRRALWDGWSRDRITVEHHDGDFPAIKAHQSVTLDPDVPRGQTYAAPTEDPRDIAVEALERVRTALAGAFSLNMRVERYNVEYAIDAVLVDFLGRRPKLAQDPKPGEPIFARVPKRYASLATMWGTVPLTKDEYDGLRKVWTELGLHLRIRDEMAAHGEFTRAVDNALMELHDKMGVTQ